MAELEVNVSPMKGAYGYPYLAMISGEDDVYRFKRSFIQFSTRDFRDFTFELPRDGVYECCIRYKDRNTDEVIKREPWWFINVDGEIYDIERSEVLDAVNDFTGILGKFFGEDFMEEYMNENGLF